MTPNPSLPADRLRRPLNSNVRCHEPGICGANPLGVKGAGEAGTSGVGAAVANAVAAAVGAAAARQLPVTAPRIKAALRGIDP